MPWLSPINPLLRITQSGTMSKDWLTVGTPFRQAAPGTERHCLTHLANPVFPGEASLMSTQAAECAVVTQFAEKGLWDAHWRWLFQLEPDRLPHRAQPRPPFHAAASEIDGRQARQVCGATGQDVAGELRRKREALSDPSDLNVSEDRMTCTEPVQTQPLFLEEMIGAGQNPKSSANRWNGPLVYLTSAAVFYDVAGSKVAVKWIGLKRDAVLCSPLCLAWLMPLSE